MRALFIGAHCDDVELGCGATIYVHRESWDISCLVLSHRVVSSHWGEDGDYDGLDIICRDSLALLGAKDVEVLDFPCTYFYRDRQAIWEAIHKAEERVNPDVVFSHYLDTHQDHETVHQETRRNFKDKSVYFYRPHNRDVGDYPVNAFFEVGDCAVEAKLKSLSKYKMFNHRGYLKENVLRSSMTHFGSQVCCYSAEAFVIEKQVVRDYQMSL